MFDYNMFNKAAKNTTDNMNYIARYFALGAIVVSMCAFSAPLSGQSGVPFLKNTGSDVIASYQAPATSGVVTLNYSDILLRQSNPGTTPEDALAGKIGLCNSLCGEEYYTGAKLNIQLDLGEDYEFGKSLPESVQLVLNLGIGTRNSTTTTCSFLPGRASTICTLSIDVDNPEQRLVIDLSNDLAAVSPCDVEICVKATVASLSAITNALVQSALRMRMWIETESGIGARLAGQPLYTHGESGITPAIARTLPSTATVSSNPVVFSWDGATCTPNFPLYQLQILRLYNLSTNNTVDTDITTDLEWENALTLETTTTTISLTLAEDRGYYIWRVRPIGNGLPDGILNPYNWGVWTQTTTTTVNYQIVGVSPPPVVSSGVFFYTGVEESRNWSFQRSHADHGQFVESMQFASKMLRVEQTQVMFQSQQERIISQTLYDNVGRPALQTLPLPFVDSEAGKQLAYIERSDLMTSGGSAYRVDDFDDYASGTYGVPSTVTGGALHTYYSGGAGSEDHVASASGYPFAQTQYFADGTNTPSRSSGPGEDHAIGGGHTSQGFYLGASDKELIALFGEEAPRGSSVRKVISSDPNGTSSVSYYSKSGALIAAGMVKNSAANPDLANLSEPVLFPASNPENPVDEGKVKIEILSSTSTVTAATNRVWGQELVLTSQQEVGLYYAIDQKTLYNECLEMCAECDFKVVIKVIDLQTNRVALDQSQSPPQETYWEHLYTPTAATWQNTSTNCIASSTRHILLGQSESSPLTIQLAPGYYKIQRELKFDQPHVVTGANGYSQTRSAWYRQLISERIYSLIDKLDDGSGLSDIDLNSLEEMFFTREAMEGIDDLSSFYTFLNDHYGGRFWSLACGEIEIPFETCEEESVPDVSEWIAYMENILGAAEVFGQNPPGTPPTIGDRMAWYCGEGYETEEHPAHPGLKSITSGSLTILLNNILADNPGDESQLWKCWQGAVHQREMLPEMKGQYYCNSLLDMFFDCVGYEPVERKTVLAEYSVTLAHVQFYDPDVTCSVTAASSGIASGTQEYRDYIYQCIKTTDLRPGTTATWMEELTSEANLDLEARCDIRCEERRNEFRDIILLAYQRKDPNVNVADIPLDALVDELIDKCIASCDIFSTTNQLGLDANQIEFDDLQPQVERAFEFMHSLLEVEVSEVGVECPDGYERCGEDPQVVSVSWNDIADERNVFLNAMNDEIQSARETILDNGDVYGTLTDLRIYLEGKFYQMIGQVGCPGNWPYDDGINAVHEGMAQAVFEQMLALVQQNRINTYTVRLTVDPTACDLNMSVVLTFDSSCPPSEIPTNNYFSSNLDEYTSGELACLLEAEANESDAPFCQLLCDEFCRDYNDEVVSMCINFISPNEFAERAQQGTEIREKSCGELVMPTIRKKLFKRVNNLIAKHQSEVLQEYNETCRSLQGLNETFTVEHTMNYYHFTLYYYDRAGRLVKTVPPAGVDYQDPDGHRAQVPNHTQATVYAYNSLGELRVSQSSDAGLSTFYYNEAGQLLVSQNAHQKVYGKHSYTLYDEFGRPYEAGEGDDFDAAVASITTSTLSVSNKTDITRTFYDDIQMTSGNVYTPGNGGVTRTARNHRHRVARSVSNYGVPADEVTTVYSYDDHGNVEWIIQDLPNVAPKYLRYEYNLLSGNTEKVIYNEGYVDEFYHCYGYDTDNRLRQAWTSDDGEFWDRDAEYDFYRHGALKRIEIGEDRVQGMDYVYTIHGWLKGINYPLLDPASDPGGDGNGSSARVAKDAFGMILGYYQGDYIRSGSVFELSSPHIASSSPSAIDLYNGNISTMQVGHSAHASVQYGTNAGDQSGYVFAYDQLNRLVGGDFRVYQSSSWTNPVNDEFDVSYTYDADGNLSSLKRYGGNGSQQLMDDFVYRYSGGGNRLIHVDDLQTNTTAYTEDIDDQSAGNYGYDETGRLISDVSEGISLIKWNAYHTIEQITYTNGRTVSFIYDATGQRVRKREVFSSNTTETFYIRDAVGTVVATYVDDPNAPNPGDVSVENPIYGMGRVGVQTRTFNKGSQDIVSYNVDVTTSTTCVRYERTVCQKMYELTDHLGNVRVVISDVKIGATLATAPFTADVHVINNYYPFGMLQPGRHVQSETYRYGFGGHEADHELKGAGNSYTTMFRQYDPRLGRWLSVDPVTHEWQSPYVGYDNNPVYYADPSGASTKKESTPIQDNSGAGSSNSGSGNTMLDFFRFLELDIATQTINPGDTFWDIENQLGLDHGSLQAWNPNLDPRTLQVGQEIITGDPFSSLDEAARNGQLPMFESDDMFMGIRTFDEPWLGNSGQLADDWFSPRWLTEKSILVSNGLVGTASWIILVKGQYFSSNEIWHLFVGKRNATLRDRIMFRWTKTSHGRSKWRWGGAVNSRKVQALRVEKIRKIGDGFAIASGVLIGADIVLSGELKPSHILNGAMVVASTTGWGAIVAGVWFVADYGTLGATWLFTDDAQSISDMLDESIGTLQMWDPLLEGQK